MSCDRRRAGFLAQMLTSAPDGPDRPTVAALDQVFRDACLPPRSSAERLANEAKVRALFSVFDKASIQRPTHNKSGMPGSDALCSGYARLYDDLRARKLLPGSARSAETHVSAPVLAQSTTPSISAIAAGQAAPAVSGSAGSAGSQQDLRNLLARVPVLIDAANDEQKLTYQSAAFEALTRCAQGILQREAQSPGALDATLANSARSFSRYMQLHSDDFNVAAWSKYFAAAICTQAETPRCHTCGQWRGDAHICPSLRFDQDGYNRFGYNRRGYSKLGFDVTGRDRQGYDNEGEDSQGYNRQGFSYQGVNRQGQHPSGYSFPPGTFPKAPNGFDVRGFSPSGFDTNGYDQQGYDQDGFDRTGYDHNGKDRSGKPHPGWTPDADGIYPDGLNAYGADRDGYMPSGFDPWGYDRAGYDYAGYDRNGWHREGYNRQGSYINGLNSKTKRDTAGYDIAGFDRNGFDRNGYSCTGYDKDGLDQAGQPRKAPDRRGKLVEPKYNQSGWDQAGYDRWGFHHKTGLTAPDAAGRQHDLRGWVYDQVANEVYDPAAPARRVAYGNQSHWQGWRGRSGRVIPSYILPSPALDARPPAPVIAPFTPPAGRSFPLSTAQHRWSTARARFDEHATAKGIRMKCPKCGQFTNGTMHTCPAFGTEVAVWASGAVTTEVGGVGPWDLLVSPLNPAYDGRYRFFGYDGPNDGYDPEGYNRQGYDLRGYDRQGYNSEGYDVLGYDREGYDRQGFNRDGKDREGQPRPRTLQEASKGLESGTDTLDNEIMAKYLGSVASALTGHPCRVVLQRGQTVEAQDGSAHYISGGFATDMKGTIYADPYPLGPKADVRHNLITAKAGIYHEIGHELTTDPAHWAYLLGVAKGSIEAEGIDKGRHLVPRIYNIIEDGRMERAISQTPGVAATLAASCRVSPRWDEQVGDDVPTGHQIQGALLYTALPYFRVRPDLIEAMSPDARTLFEELAPIVRSGALGSNEDALNATLEVVRRLEARGVFEQDDRLNVTPPPPPPAGTEAKGPQAPPSEQNQQTDQDDSIDGRKNRPSKADEDDGIDGRKNRPRKADEDDGIDGRKNRPRKADEEAQSQHQQFDDEGSEQAGSGSDAQDDAAGQEQGNRDGGEAEADAGAQQEQAGASNDSGEREGQQAGSGDASDSDEQEQEEQQAGSGSASDSDEQEDQQAGAGGASSSSGGASSSSGEQEQESRQAGAGDEQGSADDSSQAGQPGSSGGWDDQNDGWGEQNQPQAGTSQAGGDQQPDSREYPAEARPSNQGQGEEKDDEGEASSGALGAHDPNAQKRDVTEDIGASQNQGYHPDRQIIDPDLSDDPARVFSEAEINEILDRAEREAADAIDAGVRRSTTFEALGQRLHAPLPRDARHMEQRYRTPTGSVEDVKVGLSKTDNPRLLASLETRRPEIKKVAGQLSRQIDFIREQAEERIRMQTSGRLDRKRYVAAVKGSEAVRKRTEEQPETSMAVSMTLDFSGSMGSDIKSGHLHDATMVLAASFDELGMPYEVRGHGDSATQYKALDDQQFEPARSAMLAADNLGGNGCTAPIMGLATNALMARDETNKLVVSMTDGELYDHAETCRQLAEARRNGIVIFGVFLGRGHAPNMAKMNELYGKGNWTVVQNITDMPKAVGKRLVEVFEAIG